MVKQKDNLNRKRTERLSKQKKNRKIIQTGFPFCFFLFLFHIRFLFPLTVSVLFLLLQKMLISAEIGVFLPKLCFVNLWQLSVNINSVSVNFAETIYGRTLSFGDPR